MLLPIVLALFSVVPLLGAYGDNVRRIAVDTMRVAERPQTIVLGERADRLHVVAIDGAGLLVIGYDTNLRRLWTRRADLIHARRRIRFGNAVQDTAGNLYVAGEVFSPKDGFAVAKLWRFDRDGGLTESSWPMYLYGPHPNPPRVAIDREQNVHFVVATNQRVPEITIVRYRPNGMWLPTRTTLGTDGIAAVAGVTTGNDGSLTIVGNRTDTARCRPFVLRYSANGELLWTRTIDSSVSAPHVVLGCDFAPDGSFAVALRPWPIAPGTIDVATFDSAGVVRWRKRPKLRVGAWFDMRIVRDGGVSLLTDGDRAGLHLLRYDYAGRLWWTRNFSEPWNPDVGLFKRGYARNISLDSAGNTYVFGRGDTGSFVFMRFDVDGGRRWRGESGKLGSTNDRSTAYVLAAAENGTIYVGAAWGAGKRSLADTVSIVAKFHQTSPLFEFHPRSNGRGNSVPNSDTRTPKPDPRLP